ncbi:MAG TPA: flagellar FlbD family protein [Myxococcales bacterium]|nr:flagellar FlbD family protein [Myxococcales bacterium]
MTKLDGTQTVVNCEQILLVEKTPDTQIVLVGGIRILVKEPSDEVVDRCIDYKRRILHWPPVIMNTVQLDQQHSQQHSDDEMEQ